MRTLSSIPFSVPVLFLEFYVREVTYYGPASQLVSETEMKQFNLADLGKEPVKVRDHRKSRYKYILG